MQFKTTVFIYQLSHVFSLRGSKKRLKGESSTLAWFHFRNFLCFLGYVFVSVNLCLMIECRILKCVYLPGHIFSFTKSRWLKIRHDVPSTVGPEKESLISNLGLNGQLDHVAALGSSFISCATLDKYSWCSNPPPPPSRNFKDSRVYSPIT